MREAASGALRLATLTALLSWTAAGAAQPAPDEPRREAESDAGVRGGRASGPDAGTAPAGKPSAPPASRPADADPDGDADDDAPSAAAREAALREVTPFRPRLAQRPQGERPEGAEAPAAEPVPEDAEHEDEPSDEAAERESDYEDEQLEEEEALEYDAGGRAEMLALAQQLALEDGGERVVPPVDMIGIGYFTTSAPLGLRLWLSDELGVDVGVGFDLATRPVRWNGALEAGALFALAQTGNLIVFARAGMGASVRDEEADVTASVHFNGMAGGEFFLTQLGFPSLSFTGGVGLQLDLSDVGGPAFAVRLRSASAGLSVVSAAVLGFHIYF